MPPLAIGVDIACAVVVVSATLYYDERAALCFIAASKPWGRPKGPDSHWTNANVWLRTLSLREEASIEKAATERRNSFKIDYN